MTNPTAVSAEWALPTDEEERAQLAEIGALVEGPKSDAQLDAAASEICRWLAAAHADRARYLEAEAAETARIRMRYAACVEPLDRRIAQLEAIGADLARRADFGPKARSRKVGYGSYGKRAVSDVVKVTDQAKAIEWLVANDLDATTVRVKATKSVDVKEVKPIVLAHLISTGEIPDGFEHIEGHDEFFIKPDPSL